MGPSASTRRVNVELLRVVAAAMVVAIHASSATIIWSQAAGESNTPYWTALTANEASKAGVPVFFAITGWLLLSRPPGDETWLGRRLARLLLPLVVWSAVYAAEGLLLAALHDRPLWGGGEPGSWLAGQVEMFLKGPGTRAHLWYLYYAAAVTIAIWLVRRPGARLPVVAAAAAALLVPAALGEAFDERASWRAFGWAIGYSVLGYALIERRPKPLVGAGLYIAAVAAIVLLVDAQGYDSWSSAYYSPFVLAATVGVIWMVTSIQIGPSVTGLVTAAGALTFGVYLVHPLLLDALRLASEAGGPLSMWPATARLVVMWATALVLSFALAAAWRRVPGLRTLLG